MSRHTLTKEVLDRIAYTQALCWGGTGGQSVWERARAGENGIR